MFPVQRDVKVNGLAAKFQTHSRPRPFDICGVKYDIGTGFSPVAGVLIVKNILRHFS